MKRSRGDEDGQAGSEPDDEDAKEAGDEDEGEEYDEDIGEGESGEGEEEYEGEDGMGEDELGEGEGEDSARSEDRGEDEGDEGDSSEEYAGEDGADQNAQGGVVHILDSDEEGEGREDVAQMASGGADSGEGEGEHEYDIDVADVEDEKRGEYDELASAGEEQAKAENGDAERGGVDEAGAVETTLARTTKRQRADGTAGEGGRDNWVHATAEALKAEGEQSRLRMELLRERQRADDLEHQRDFVAASERRLREQLETLRVCSEEQQVAMQRKASEAFLKLEELRDTSAAELRAERQKRRAALAEAHAETVALRAKLDEAQRSARVAQSALDAAKEKSGVAAQFEHAADHALVAELKDELASARRKLEDAAELRELNASMSAQIKRNEQAAAQLAAAKAEAQRARQEADALRRSLDDAADLKRRLTFSELLEHEHKQLQQAHEVLTSTLERWRVLFAREGCAVGTEAEGEGGGAAVESMAEAVAATLRALRQQHADSVAENSAKDAKLRQIKEEAAAQEQRLQEATAKGVATAARCDELEKSVKRLEMRCAQLQEECTGLRSLVHELEQDREQRRKQLLAGARVAELSENNAVEKQAAALQAERLSRAEARASALEAQLEDVQAKLRSANQALCEKSLALAAAVKEREYIALSESLSEQLRRADANANAGATQRQNANAAAAAAAHSAGGARVCAHAADPAAGECAASHRSKPSKILHLSDNPSARGEKALVETLKAKLQALQMQLEAQQQQHASSVLAAQQQSGKDGEVAATAISPHLDLEVEDLKAQVTSLTTQKDRLAKVFKDKIDEFRKAVMSLTGFRVDLPETRRYHLYSVYAHRSDVLYFRCNAQGEMELLDSAFASQLQPQIAMYLQDRHSLPAFLSAVTLRLFSELEQ